MLKSRSLLTARWVLLLMSFFGFVVAYIIRANLSVAIIAMVHPIKSVRKTYVCNSSIFSHHLAKRPWLIPSNNNQSQNAIQNRGEILANNGPSPTLEALHWDKITQGYVLASFFYGYIVTQIPGGWLSYKYGSKHVLGFGVLLASILTLLNPVLARASPYALMVSRFGQGLGEGVMLPAMHHLISKWAEPMQRTRMATIIYSGIPIGTILAMPMSGFLAKYGFAGGWPSIFYLTGILGCVWFFLWCFLVFENPFVHPRISEAEKQLLHRAEQPPLKQEWKDIPLMAIFKSLPFWAICVSNVAHTWGLYTFITVLPTYLRDVLNLDINSNGLFSAIPFVAMWVFIVVGGQVADYLRCTHSTPTVVVRKVINSLGLFVPAALFVGLSYVGCREVMAISLLTGAAAFLGLANSGYMVNPLDIAPPYAGILFSLSNTFGTLSGIISPSVTSAFIAKESGPDEWRKVFILSAVILWVGATFYGLCASGIQQPWSSKKIVTIIHSNKDNHPEEIEEAKREML